MRTPLRAPFTDAQTAVVALIVQGADVGECAAKLGVSRTSAWERAAAAAKKIPGDLPVWPRILVWHRGGTPEVLGAK